MNRHPVVPASPRNLAKVLIIVASVILASAGVFIAAPYLAAPIASRSLMHLLSRLPGSFEHSPIEVASRKRLHISKLSWTEPSCCSLEVRDIEFELNFWALLMGTTPIKQVDIGYLRASVGDVKNPFRGLSKAFTQKTIKFKDPMRLAIPDISVSSIEASFELPHKTIMVTNGTLSLHPRSDSFDSSSRQLHAELDITIDHIYMKKVIADLFLEPGLKPEKLSVTFTPPLEHMIEMGTASIKSISITPNRIMLLEPSWRRKGLSISADSLKLDFNVEHQRALSLQHLLSWRDYIEDCLTSVSEIEVDKPLFDIELARELPPVVQTSQTDMQPREGAFKRRVLEAFQDVKSRVQTTNRALSSLVKEMPWNKVRVYGATVRYLSPETAVPERSFANLDAYYMKDPTTGRMETRVLFECPESGTEKNEAFLQYEPSSATTTISFRAAYIPLYPYRAFLPRWLVATRESSVSRSELSVSFNNEEFRLNGAINLRDVTVNAASLASVPMHGLYLGFKGSVAIEFVRDEIDISDGVFTVGRVLIPFSLAASSLSSFPRIRVQARLDKVPAQDIVSSIPQEAVPALEGVRLAGTFSMKMTLDLDTRDLASMKVNFDPDVSDLKVLDLGKGVNLDLLQTEFLHRIEEGGGKVIGRVIGPSSPDWLPLSNVPPHLINALTTSEDSQFFRHHGFSLSGIRRSMLINLERGGFYQGASTLSQQLVKNLFLSHEKTLARKLQEVFITWQLERFLSKEKILELYLNVIEWGPDVFGLTQAAMHYFGKLPKELTVLESAFLVSIIPNPKVYHAQFEKGSLTPAFDRRVRSLINEMRRRGLLSAEEAEAALAEKLRFVPVNESLEKSDEGPPDEEFTD